MGDHDYQRGMYAMNVDSSSSYAQPVPPRYVLLTENGGDPSLRPPPYRRNIPRYHSRQHARVGSCCCRCICCSCCVLLFMILSIFGSLYFAYSYYKPVLPSYSVVDFGVGAFQLERDLSLYTEFVVKVRAENPNAKISIIYHKGSLVTVLYSNSTLCSGKLPAFYQGHRNTTVMTVTLKGKSGFGSGLQEALMDNRQTGRIPLDINVRVPVQLVVGEIMLRKVTVLIHCSLVVDSLSPKKKVAIKSSKYDINIKL